VRILALDTATENCSAALLINGRLLEREELIGRGHAERVLPMIDELLREAALKLPDLAAVAFGRGPGAFTGVRLAASITQGLAYAAGLKVAPVSDLGAVAQRALALPGAPPRVLVCADARMNEVYWACFERSPEGFAVTASPERVGSPESVEIPATWQREGGVGAGSGFAAYPALIARFEPKLWTIHAGLLPRASEIATLALEEAARGRLLDPEQALPVYLRDDVATPAGGRSLN
jgi:tRNA threonylcarbamoyladenosine biosynthesis protein TsaB